MEERFKQYTVLEYKIKHLQPIKIHEGDVVTVKYEKSIFRGVVTYIDTAFLEVDCSKEFKSNLMQFDYKRIEDICVRNKN